jgi:peptide/nickel transport system ATP-binding protein
MTQPVLSIRGLSVVLPADADRAHAISDVSLDILSGQTLCVVGESGSGKSVMATTVMGLLPKELRTVAGDIALQGESLLQASTARLRQLRGRTMGMVFQEPMTGPEPGHDLR